MGIVNPAQSLIYEEIPEEGERARIEDAILNRREDATERLMEYAERVKGEKVAGGERERVTRSVWPVTPLEERLSYALVKGIGDYLEEDLTEALTRYPRAVDIIDKPLMDGMNRVGRPLWVGQDVPANQVV